MSSDRGAAALAERLNLVLIDRKPSWLSDTVAGLVAIGEFRNAADAILGERGVFLPDGLPLFVEQMAAEIERVWRQPGSSGVDPVAAALTPEADR